MLMINISLGQPTLDMAEEIACALEKLEGKKPSRSHVFRLAVAAMRKRMSDECLINEPRDRKRQSA